VSFSAARLRRQLPSSACLGASLVLAACRFGNPSFGRTAGPLYLPGGGQSNRKAATGRTAAKRMTAADDLVAQAEGDGGGMDGVPEKYEHRREGMSMIELRRPDPALPRRAGPTAAGRYRYDQGQSTSPADPWQVVHPGGRLQFTDYEPNYADRMKLVIARTGRSCSRAIRVYLPPSWLQLFQQATRRVRRGRLVPAAAVEGPPLANDAPPRRDAARVGNDLVGPVPLRCLHPRNPRLLVRRPPDPRRVRERRGGNWPAPGPARTWSARPVWTWRERACLGRGKRYL
jgi:hypothetical protein